MAKKRKVEPTGEDNGRAYAEYFEGLVNKASLQELAAWLVELALIHHRDHPPYYYYGDGPQPDPLFETAARWGINVDAIKSAATESRKSDNGKRKATARAD